MLELLLIFIIMFNQKQQFAERGATPCGYSYYMTETKDKLPIVVGNTRTFEEAKQIVNNQKYYDDKLREQIKNAKKNIP